MTQLLWNRVIRVRIRHKNSEAVFTYRNKEQGIYEIHFSVPFSDQAKPTECSVSIYNLSKTSRSKIRKGATVTIEAGYKGDIGVIAKGTINKVQPSALKGVDRITSFTFLEGVDYSKKRDVNITFAAGTKGRTIIRRVASVAKIPISVINIPDKNNKVYKKGYTANGGGFAILEEVAEDCKVAMYYRRGNIMIRPITSGDDERFTLNTDTGLVSSPQPFESNKKWGWEIESLLQHRIATASIIDLRSKSVRGRFRVKNGTHSFDGSNFITSCEVIANARK